MTYHRVLLGGSPAHCYIGLVDAAKFFALVLGTALANLARVYYARHKARLAARTVIPAQRNWRGEYVPDLHLTRLKRSILAAWVAVTIAAFLYSYQIMTGDDLVASLWEKI